MCKCSDARRRIGTPGPTGIDHDRADLGSERLLVKTEVRRHELAAEDRFLPRDRDADLADPTAGSGLDHRAVDASEGLCLGIDGDVADAAGVVVMAAAADVSRGREARAPDGRSAAGVCDVRDDAGNAGPGGRDILHRIRPSAVNTTRRGHRPPDRAHVVAVGVGGECAAPQGGASPGRRRHRVDIARGLHPQVVDGVVGRRGAGVRRPDIAALANVAAGGRERTVADRMARGGRRRDRTDAPLAPEGRPDDSPSHQSTRAASIASIATRCISEADSTSATSATTPRLDRSDRADAGGQ